jgi:hypothetical protein
LVALLLIERVPLAAPLAAGEKTTLKLVLWPAASVTGGARPLTLKPVPLAEARETVTLVALPLVRVTECDCWLPTWTDPRFKLAGLALSEPAASPVPASGTLSVELPVTKAMFPETLALL